MIHFLYTIFIGLPSLVAATAGPMENPATRWRSIRCPTSNATLPTPTYGQDGGVFTVCDETLIHAPLVAAYNALLDFKSYPKWNTFVVNVGLPTNITSTPEDDYIGMVMAFTSQGIVPGVNSSSSEIITVMSSERSRGYAVAAWRSDDGANGTILRAEHPTVLTDVGNGSVRSVSYETYYEGPGIVVVLPLEGNLQERFATENRDLKAYVEGFEKFKSSDSGHDDGGRRLVGR